MKRKLIGLLTAYPEGIYARLQDEEYVLPALQVKAVDTTGAGDSFVSGFLAAVLEKQSGEDCLRAGLARAALCVQHMGAV